MAEASGRAPSTPRDAPSTSGDPAAAPFAVLVRRKWIVVVAVVVTVVVAVVLSALRTPVYEASAEVVVAPGGGGALVDDRDAGTAADDVVERAIETEIEVVEGRDVRDRVQDVLDLDEPPPEASATAVDGADVISISVRDTNAENAATLADAYARASIEVRRERAVEQLVAASAQVQDEIDELGARIDALPADAPRRARLAARRTNLESTLDELRDDVAQRTGGAVVIEAARVPDDPVEPTPWRTAVLALVVGSLIGAGAAVVVERVDDRARRTGEQAGDGRRDEGAGGDRGGAPSAPGAWPPPPTPGTDAPPSAAGWPAPAPTEPLAPPSPR